MLNKEQLDGNEIGWTNWGVKCYNTNFGQVELDENTEELVFCCIGIGRNQGNTEIGIKIIDGEFQIYKDTFGSIYAELCSKNFPYPCNTKQDIEISEVLKILQNDDNDSIAAIIVKKEIVRLMYNKLKFELQELVLLKGLLGSWRKPIKKSDLIERIPIIERTPIRRSS